MFSRLLQFGLLTLLVALLGACASASKHQAANLPDGKPEKLYERGLKQMDKRNYSLAIETFEKLEAKYPFGKYAQLAQLQTAYAHYKLGEPDAAIVAADQFVKLNPQHERVDFAYYIKATANATRYKGLFDKFFHKDLGDLDPNPLKQAFSDYKQLIRRFPNSDYVEESRQRMIDLRNALASHDLKIAEFYWRRGAWIAVINRCRDILVEYDGSTVLPHALALMAKAYNKLGLQEDYDETVSVFKTNYPDKLSLLKEGWKLF